ncbi:transglycosylase SLT domain-containing protein [Gordonia sp. CPCC 205515]|uniref:transglycosylase SLT domain-containing protein n=1 Tax=Gordonia sp. CPCC 205515 TaxID=3140791 RepID=UPI003AF3DD04
MSVVSKSLHRVRTASFPRVNYALGAGTLAAATAVTAASLLLSEPAHAEHTIATPASAAQSVAEVTPAPKPAPLAANFPAPAPAKPVYGDNLDGWIRESLDIMKKNNIPGSYESIQRNIMRESTGNPQAINLYDSNAAAGIPSKGLLQVIDPTFAAYHVEGTKFDVYDPVANIVAACNYAAHTYGSMDNVNSAY